MNRNMSMVNRGMVNQRSTSNTSVLFPSTAEHNPHLLLFLVLVAGDPVSLTLDPVSLTLDPVFNPSSTPFISSNLTVLTSPPPLTTFPGSAAPTTGISEASHCWNGFATKYPSVENHFVKGAASSTVCHVSAFELPLRVDEVRYRTVRL